MPPHSPDIPSAPAGCLLRLFWTLAGNSIVYLTLITIAVRATPLPSVLDAVVWVTTGLMLLARWFDITRFNGRTLANESATVGHWRRYAMLVVGVTLGAWLLARWFAGSLAFAAALER